MAESILKDTKILVVDDQPANLEIMACFLQALGVQTLTLSSGEEVSDCAAAEQPDLILLDVMMPGKDGYSTCRELKSNPLTAEIPVIFASALKHADEKVKGFEVGGVDYITKPLELAEVKARLETHLHLRQRQSQLQDLNQKLTQEVRQRQHEAEILRQVQTQLQVRNQKLQELATVDALTRIGNRRRFDQALLVEWRRAQREQTPLSLILCDVDFFKLYNDHFGHQQGDLCLQEIAAALLSCLKRPSDLLCRYGGEEFAVILPNTHAQGALYLAENLRQAVAAKQLQCPVLPSASSDCVSLSLGVATHSPTRPFKGGAVALLSGADRALYRAKAQGRNRVFNLEPEREVEILVGSAPSGS